ncbi:HNH endonuclease [Mesorhizobium sp. B2-5-12]|nr:HNH endonuclease [Mesorhizobium sp. B2-5-12]TPK19152.1 HNH endonuclease [Mesorhizobium sp. B2-5-6]
MDEVRAILKRQNYKCVECGVSVRKKESRHVDHIMPVALGGHNYATNLQVLCKQCNLYKGARDPIDFARIKGRLV